ncbi:uncharacterized protein LOC124690775 [Lolium rigidum]|uniref:uncharacterized protein LOC124690775 n=1 Tax=Lolium rigidum TaxID=89674 RepID=UPI001F5CE239|nr:uncharacterized protein LOC124690775 [Lolium rigidum]
MATASTGGARMPSPRYCLWRGEAAPPTKRSSPRGVDWSKHHHRPPYSSNPLPVVFSPYASFSTAATAARAVAPASHSLPSISFSPCSSVEATALAKNGVSAREAPPEYMARSSSLCAGAAAALVSFRAHLRLALALLSSRCTSTPEHRHNDVLQPVKVERERRSREVEVAVVLCAIVTGQGTSATVLNGEHKSTCRFQYICAYKVLDKKPVSRFQFIYAYKVLGKKPDLRRSSGRMCCY